MSAFEAAGVAVYALSYDEPDALRDFRDAHEISYTLLSDPNSEVIRAFGILNTLIAEDDHPWFGIPYPGTYIIDAAGTITHKFFDNNLAVRAGPEQLLRAIHGDPLMLREASERASATAEVQVRVALDGERLARTVQKDIVVQFAVPAGKHVYAQPAPEGSVAVDVVLDDNPRVVERGLVRPVAEPHTLAGSGEVFDVHHGVFELRLPITVNGSVRQEDGGAVTVSGQVRWQSCDDQVCDLPASQRFELQLELAESPGVAIGNGEGAAREPNAMAHFQHMIERRR